jgi:hypothetical protein
VSVRFDLVAVFDVFSFLWAIPVGAGETAGGVIMR